MLLLFPSHDRALQSEKMIIILFQALLQYQQGGMCTYKGVTWPFFKVNPNTLDDIFSVKVDSTWETDQLLVNCNAGCYVTRPLSADGVPY